MKGLELERWNIDFGVGKSIRYHSYRRSFWRSLDYWTKVLTVISGLAVLIAFLNDHKYASAVFASCVAALSTLDIVLGFSDRSRDHDVLYRRFSQLAQDIAECITPSALDLSKWKRQRLEIEMDEPGVMNWLERRCAAEEAISRGCAVNQAWRLNRWQLLLSQVAMWPSLPVGGS